MEVRCDTEQWIADRRQKSDEEIEHLRAAQQVTEQTIQVACEMITSVVVLSVRSPGSEIAFPKKCFIWLHFANRPRLAMEKPGDLRVS